MLKRTRHNNATGTIEPMKHKYSKPASGFESLNLVSPSFNPCIPAIIAALGLNLKTSTSLTQNQPALSLKLSDQSMRWLLLPKLKYAIRKQQQPHTNSNKHKLTPLLWAISQYILSNYKLASQGGDIPKRSVTNTLYFFYKLHKLALTSNIQRALQLNFAKESKKNHLLLAWPSLNKRLLQNQFIRLIFDTYDLELCYLYQITASELSAPSASKERKKVGSWFNSHVDFYEQAMFEDNEYLCFFYLKSMDTIVAYFALSENLDTLEYLYVSEKRQGQGLGSLLFMILAKIMSGYDISNIELESTPTKQANSFYSGFGLRAHTYNDHGKLQPMDQENIDPECSHIYRATLPLDRAIIQEKMKGLITKAKRNSNYQPSLFQPDHTNGSKTTEVASPKH